MIFENFKKKLSEHLAGGLIWMTLGKESLLIWPLTWVLALLSKFKNTLGHIEAGRYEEASIEMLDSRWANQVGHRAKCLSDMMRTGEDNDH